MRCVTPLSPWTFCVVLLLGASGASAAAGEATKRAGSDDTARLQMMLQQLNTEKTTLAAENTKLKAELDKVKSQLDAAVKERDSGVAKLGRNTQDLVNTQAKSESLQRGFDTLKSRFDQLVEQFRATVAAMNDLEAERDDLKSLASAYDVRVTKCEQNNEALYAADLELIDLYERKGVMTALMQREPVTKLKRVELENLMDQYRALADEMRLNRPVALPPAASETSKPGATASER